MSSSSKAKHKKLNPKLAQILRELGGENGVEVAENLYNIEADEITDDDLAELCGIKLNIVRKILYILYEHKLAEFRKVRNKQNGWFIYYWHETYENIRDLVKCKQETVLEKLTARLNYEDENVFYKCENPGEYEEGSELYEYVERKKREQEKNIQMARRSGKDPSEYLKPIEKPECKFITTFGPAMDLDFKCPKCGGTLNHYENERVKEFLREKIAVLRQNIKTFCA